MKADFQSEADLCDWLISKANQTGCKVYAETGGWDMLIIRPDGLQIGVQAKLDANLKVLAQALYGHQVDYWPRPHFRAVLVPKCKADFEEIAHCCRVAVLIPRGSTFLLDSEPAPYWQWKVETPVDLPEFVPDMRAGLPSPLQLSTWKIKAIRLCLRLRANGFVTADDFKSIGLDSSRWIRTSRSWLVNDGTRKGRYVCRPGVVLPDEKHPTVARAIVEKDAKPAEAA